MQGYYQIEDSPIVAVSGPRFLSVVCQYKEINMPKLLMTSSFTIVDGGKNTVNGITVRRLLLSDSEGPPINVYTST